MSEMIEMADKMMHDEWKEINDTVSANKKVYSKRKKDMV